MGFTVEATRHHTSTVLAAARKLKITIRADVGAPNPPRLLSARTAATPIDIATATQSSVLRDSTRRRHLERTGVT